MRHVRVLLLSLLALLAFAAALLFSGGPPGHAATITVNSFTDNVSDNTVCTLREAITAANTDTASGATAGECAAGSGADIINVPAGTYSLSIIGGPEDANASGDLDITADLTIIGAGAATTVVQAGVTFNTGIDRVFHIPGATTVDISGLTIRFGRTSDGGGISNSGTLTVTNSTVSDNSASADGGGIFNNVGTLTLNNSTVSGNTAANNGGGINNFFGSATLNNSTVSGNQATDGGGISNFFGSATLNNSTVSGNSASDDGGGIFNDAFGSATLKNTIVANSTGGDCFGIAPTSTGYNLDSDGTCNLTATGDLPNTNPLLGSLANNGGPTETHALLSGSPAIDAGNPATPGSGGNACEASDQRGVARPQGAACDIGAYEFGPFTFTVTKTADTNDGTCDADCSLREAIGAANALAGADTITVPAGTYTLSIAGAGEDANLTGDLDVTADLTINGAGAATTIIQACAIVPPSTSCTGLDRVFHIDPSAAGVTAEISGLTIQNGSASFGGGIQNSGTLTIDSSTVSGNSAGAFGPGGGIFNDGTLTLTSSTVSGNFAGSGGGIRNDGTVTLTNSTVSGNTGNPGGGIRNFGTATLTSSTVSGNTAPSAGGGISNFTGASATLKNTIVANSPSGGDCSGIITSDGYNLDSDGSCGLSGTGDLPSGNANLGSLALNAPGTTATHALLPGSDAIDAGNPATPGSGGNACEASDQRGVARPQGAACDIGAYEFEPCSTLVDTDGDGALDSLECHVGTDVLVPCSATTGDNNEDPDAQVEDLNDTRDVTGADLSLIAADIGQNVPPALVRKDIAPDPAGDNQITGADLSRVAADIGTAC